MAFTKQAEFTKKVTDLTDVPSQNMTPSQIKSYFQTPSDELKTTVNKLVDDLNGSGWVDTPRLGSKVVTREKVAPGAIGVNEIDPSIMNQPTTAIGVQAKLDDHTSQLAKEAKDITVLFNNVVFVGNYPRLVPEVEDTPRINRAIAASPVGSTIMFESKQYDIGTIVILLPNRTYQGCGWSTIFRQKNGANLLQLFQFASNTQTNDSVQIHDIRIDGNKANNTTGHGVYLFAMRFSTVEKVKIENCPQTGFYFDGSPTYKGSTVHIKDCDTSANGGYGIFLGIYTEDMHVYGGDHGLNGNNGIYLGSPSSSIRLTTVWASQNNNSGIYINDNAVGSQVMLSQIEGNSGHGIEVHASHIFIFGNKLYDNANVPANYGLYDGVYVNGVSGANVVDVTVIGNKIFSGLYASTGFYRNAIRLDTYHDNCYVFGNDVKYLGNGVIDPTKKAVYGLKEGDLSDYTWHKSATRVHVDVSNIPFSFGAWSKVLFNGVSMDKESEWNATDRQFVAKERGIYQINASLLWNAGTAGKQFLLSLYKNNAEYARLGGANAVGTDTVYTSGNSMVQLEIGDTLDIRAFCSGSNDSILASSAFSYFEVVKIR